MEYLIILIISLVAFFIGKQTIFIITFLPVIWCTILGIIFSYKKQNINIKKYEKIATVGLLLIGAKYGTIAGPYFYEIINLGIVFLFQELGQILVPIIAVPIGILLGMKRITIGACSSLCREPALGVIGETYGIDSDEGFGVTSMYILGYILAPIAFSIIGSLAQYTNFNPISLAMACGLGSTTMLVSVSSALAETMPAQASMIYGFGATSTMLSAITDILIMNFLQLPLANWIYRRLHK